MNADDIRIAAGQVTAYALLNTDSYLVTNWTRQTDMSASDEWMASQPEFGMTQARRNSFEVGNGGFYGKYSGIVSFFLLTEDMRQYIETTILNDKGIGRITGYFHTPTGFKVLSGELISPFSSNPETGYTRFSDDYYHNVNYQFRRGVELTTSNILLESGDNLLLESGDFIALESQ